MGPVRLVICWTQDILSKLFDFMCFCLVRKWMQFVFWKNLTHFCNIHFFKTDFIFFNFRSFEGSSVNWPMPSTPLAVCAVSLSSAGHWADRMCHENHEMFFSFFFRILMLQNFCSLYTFRIMDKARSPCGAGLSISVCLERDRLLYTWYSFRNKDYSVCSMPAFTSQVGRWPPIWETIFFWGGSYSCWLRCGSTVYSEQNQTKFWELHVFFQDLAWLDTGNEAIYSVENWRGCLRLPHLIYFPITNVSLVLLAIYVIHNLISFFLLWLGSVAVVVI